MKRLGHALDSLDSPAPVAAIRFLALVGLRVSEALAVRWEHVDMETGRLLIPQSKTGRRWHTLPAPALALLDGIDQKGAFVFTTTGSAPITYRTVRKHFAEACERAGIEGARLHDLRRGVVSAAARAGESVPVLQALLGHRTSTQALKYAAQMDTTAEAARSRVAAEMAEAMGYDAENVVQFRETA